MNQVPPPSSVLPKTLLSAVSEASRLDTLKVLTSVVLPTFGKGVIIRRPAVEGLAGRFNLDLSAVRLMQKLRRKYGASPLLLKIPFRPQLLLLGAKDVEFVLSRAPQPFSPATKEKRAALNHLEPGNVLISDPPRRAQTRPYHEAALATSERHHPLVSRFQAVIDEEIERIISADGRQELDWPLFAAAWFKIVRRLVLGDSAREDEGLTDLLNHLRSRSNWAFFLRKDRKLLEEFQRIVQRYADRSEGGSLVGFGPKDQSINPPSQIAQWLFAFDPAGMATFRTLALLATYPEHLAAAQAEALAGETERPLTRAYFLEALRLWPTTPAILRETTTEIAVPKVKEGTGLIIFTPFFHRDDANLKCAHRMEPSIWLDGDDALPLKGLVPFSAGPAMCPAHNLVPLVATMAIGAILARASIKLTSPTMAPSALPGTLDHFALKFDARRSTSSGT
ncbi:cytochrome P450 [Rhizobium halophilum]|uniref:cytochrome P450 n=1 Tax=Rhizobium halophilum TaxID=2846852 RepID=UPI001EFE74E4|nr:cytochrome P450 [Rhizobium halophilum]MCF6371288.1 cytochrome P450 [Rhizobium halophilum]